MLEKLFPLYSEPESERKLSPEEVKQFRFSTEKELRQINPVLPDEIEDSFVKEMGKSKLTVLKLKQWLLWSKVACIKQLNLPLLLPITFESYLEFIIKYQKLKEIPEINSTLMLYQTHTLIRAELTRAIRQTNELTVLQQQFLYSSLSRFIFTERQYLYKIVSVLYSIEHLSLGGQYKSNLVLLAKLASRSLDSFRSLVLEHRLIRYKITSTELLKKVQLRECRKQLKRMDRVVAYDEELQSLLKKYSKCVLTKGMLKLSPSVSLRWLLLWDTKGIGKLYKRNELDNPMWGLLFEYAQAQKLLVAVLRKDREERAFGIALRMCEYFLKGKICSYEEYCSGTTDLKLAKLFWNIVLVIARALSKDRVKVADVTGIFAMAGREEDNIPHIVLTNPFDDFDIDAIFVAFGDERIPFSKKVYKLLRGENSFTQICYKEYPRVTLNFAIGGVEFAAEIPHSLLTNLTQQLTLRLFTPQQLCFDNNLLVLAVEPTYYIENTVLEIEVDSKSSISEDLAAVCKLTKSSKGDNAIQVEGSVKKVKGIYEVVLPSLKGPKEAAYVGLVVSLLREKDEKGIITMLTSLRHNDETDHKLLKKSFVVTLPRNMLVSVHGSRYGYSRAIQTEIDSAQHVTISKVTIDVEGATSDFGTVGSETRLDDGDAGGAKAASRGQDQVPHSSQERRPENQRPSLHPLQVSQRHRVLSPYSHRRRSLPLPH